MAVVRSRSAVKKVKKTTAVKHKTVHGRIAHFNALATVPGDFNPDSPKKKHYAKLKAVATKHQRKEGVCEPDHLGRPRTRSLTSKKCVLADSKTMRSQGQCVPRVRTLKSGRQVLVHRIANPDYGRRKGEPFCIKSGGAKAKLIALHSNKPDLACAPHLKAVEGAHRVPVWTGKYKNNGEKEYRTTFKESIRCVKREGQQKQCPVGQALYQVKKTAKVFAKGSGAVNKKTGIKAPLKYTTKPVTKFICSKAKPAGAIGNAKPGTLPPKLHIAAKKVVDQDTLGRPVYRTHHPKHPVETNWGVQKHGASKNHAYRRTAQHKETVSYLRKADRANAAKKRAAARKRTAAKKRTAVWNAEIANEGTRFKLTKKGKGKGKKSATTHAKSAKKASVVADKNAVAAKKAATAAAAAARNAKKAAASAQTAAAGTRTSGRARKQVQKYGF